MANLSPILYLFTSRAPTERDALTPSFRSLIFRSLPFSRLTMFSIQLNQRSQGRSSIRRNRRGTDGKATCILVINVNHAADSSLLHLQHGLDAQPYTPALVLPTLSSLRTNRTERYEMSFFFIPAFVNNHTRASPAEIHHMRWTSSLTATPKRTMALAMSGNSRPLSKMLGHP